ncbi:MAG: ankyrin repeat domain-containing protein [Candidatus Baltobacteraceae bacterium]
MSDIFALIAARDETGVREILEKNPVCAHVANGDGISALMWALYHHQPQLAELIRAQGVELTVWEAAAIGDGRTLSRIIKVDPHKVNEAGPDGFFPVHLAAFFKHPACVELLLENGADPNVVARNHSRVRPLHSAVAGRDLACVQHLLAAQAEPNVQQAGGFTPLHSAAEHGDTEIYDALIAAGAPRAS